MNVICNNCLGGRLYLINNLLFNNPFIWSRLYVEDFITLVNNYKHINFNKIDLLLEYRLKHDCVKCRIDNTINLHFGHYVYDPLVETPTVNDINVVYKDILEYTKNKYMSRLSRFNKDNVKFIYSFNNAISAKTSNSLYLKQLTKLINVKNPDLYILIHKSKAETFNIELPKNIIVFDDDILEQKGRRLGLSVYNHLISKNINL